MQMTISRWLVRALGMLCLALPLTLPTAAEAAKAKPQATAKGKHKVAAKKHKAVAKKAKTTKHAKTAGLRKIAKAHARPKAQRHQPATSLDDSNNDRLALPGKPEAAPEAGAAARAAQTACAIDGKIYLLADCQQLAAN